jgi:hypothetical protein
MARRHVPFLQTPYNINYHIPVVFIGNKTMKIEIQSFAIVVRIPIKLNLQERKRLSLEQTITYTIRVVISTAVTALILIKKKFK